MSTQKKKVAPKARPKTRAGVGGVTGGSESPETQQDINDEMEGRNYLENHLLLCPIGEPATHTSLAACLHQISAMQGIDKPAENAIRAVAFLLGEMEGTQINKLLQDSFNTQITEITSDMAMLIKDAKDQLQEQFKVNENKLTITRSSSPGSTRQALTPQLPPTPHLMQIRGWRQKRGLRPGSF